VKNYLPERNNGQVRIFGPNDAQSVRYQTHADLVEQPVAFGESTNEQDVLKLKLSITMVAKV